MIAIAPSGIGVAYAGTPTIETNTVATVHWKEAATADLDAGQAAGARRTSA